MSAVPTQGPFKIKQFQPVSIKSSGVNTAAAAVATGCTTRQLVDTEVANMLLSFTCPRDHEITGFIACSTLCFNKKQFNQNEIGSATISEHVFKHFNSSL